jgi:hypothetical protein
MRTEEEVRQRLLRYKAGMAEVENSHSLVKGITKTFYNQAMLELEWVLNDILPEPVNDVEQSLLSPRATRSPSLNLPP